MLAFMLARLREPSTYAGLGAVFAAAGLHPNEAALSGIVNIAVALAGVLAVVLPEGQK